MASSALKVVAIETEVEDGVDRDPRPFHSREDFLLDERDAEFGVSAQQLRINLIERLRRRPGFRRGEVIDLLVVDRRMADARPFRLFHRLPTTKGLKPPFQQPFRLTLLFRDKSNGVFVQALRGHIRLDRANEAIFVSVDLNRTHTIDGLLDGRHN